MKNKLLFLITVILSVAGWAQDRSGSFYDSISSRYKNYYTLGNLQVSPDGRYTSVKKWYMTSRDTMLISDREKPGMPILTLIRKNSYFSFLGKNRLLAFGDSEAELISLPDLKRIQFSQVKQVAGLKTTGQYCILHNNGDLKVYNAEDTQIFEFQNVKNLLTDSRRKAFMLCEKNGLKEIISLSGNRAKTIYRTDAQIKRIHTSESEKHLIITEILQDRQEIRVTFVDWANDKISSFSLGSANGLSLVRVWETGKGEAYLIDVTKKSAEEKILPELWYAGDGNLMAKQEFPVQHKYYSWNTAGSVLDDIPADRFPFFAPVNDRKFLLAFDPYKKYRYATIFPAPDVYLYDIAHKKYTQIFEDSEDLMISPKGRYLLSFSYTSKQWIGKDISGNRSFTVPKHLTARPVYDETENYAWFESKNGLWKLDLNSGKTVQVKGTENMHAALQDYKRHLIVDFGNMNSWYMYSGSKTLLKLRNAENNASWHMYTNRNFQKILPPSSENITDLKTDDQMKYAFFTEENYSLPSRLAYRKISSKIEDKVVMGPCNLKDKTAEKVRQQIIQYADSSGNKLKGVLYYPSDFKENMKYPMIVSIYQVQSSTSNDYRYPKHSTIGFDLRTLTERGYFVYLPDIVYSASGSGISALDCVNRSLDALASNKNIDMDRVGLTGHSMGGYETVFIATQSKRFRTYIAGAAQTDVVRAYFSYNYNMRTPYMWQYENGQHFMNVPFSADTDLYFRNNPIHYVHRVSAPMLIWTGKKDENVHWGHTMEFFMGLVRNGKKAVALFYPDGFHNLGKETGEAKDLNRRALEWWDYFLKDKKEIDWINREMKEDAD